MIVLPRTRLASGFQPDYLSIPRIGRKLIGRKQATLTGTPGPLRPFCGPVGHQYDGSTQYDNFTISESCAANMIIAASFTSPSPTGAAFQVAAGIGDAAATERFFIVETSATGVIDARIRGTTAGTILRLDGPTAVVGQRYNVVAISRGIQNHVMFVNGVRYEDVATSIGSYTGTMGNFSTGAVNRFGTVIAYGGHNVNQAWTNFGYDPGDAWLRAWSLDPDILLRRDVIYVKAASAAAFNPAWARAANQTIVGGQIAS